MRIKYLIPFLVFVLIFGFALACGGSEKDKRFEEKKQELEEKQKEYNKQKEEAVAKENKEEIAVEEEQSEEVDLSAMSLDEQIKYIIKINIGDETNMDLPRINTINTEEEKEDGKLVYLCLNGDDNFTANMIRRGMWIDSIKLFKYLFTIEEIGEITIIWQFELTDKYGNSELTKVMGMTLTREIEEKINWDSFLTDNIPNVTEDYWESPIFSE